MRVFHIKGFQGLFLLLLAVLAVLAVVVALPASFMMVLWNALVFEGLRGPEIDFVQGLLLWGIVAIALKLIFKPEIQLQFQQADTLETHERAKKAFLPPSASEQDCGGTDTKPPLAQKDAPPAEPKH